MLRVRTMSMAELQALPVVNGIEDAAAALGIGITRAYRQAREDGALAGPVAPCPVRLDGRKFKVTRFDLFAALGLDPVTGVPVAQYSPRPGEAA